MSNVKNDLSPATAILSGGKLCQRLFSALPYYQTYHHLFLLYVPLFLLKGNASYYIIRFSVIHIPSCGLNIRVLQVKSGTSALQMSPQLSLLVNFESIANFQLLGFP